MTFIRKTLPEQPYLYVERECPYGPEIAEAMGSGFAAVFGHVSAQGITPLSMPMSIYLGMDPEILRFRAAVMVNAEDAAKADGDVKAATLPAGDAMSTMHLGSYDKMNETHQALWQYMETEKTPAKMPVWEIYIDDPAKTPADKLRTEIYRMIDGNA
ncbi:MAG: GyrI-like domain-containing protein [Pseudomonadota bacterium]